MQGNFARDSAPVGARRDRRLALLAGVPFVTALALASPAFAACGASHPAGVHSGAIRTGAHAPTSAVKTGAGGGGSGSGSLGCANGASVPAPHGPAAPHGLSIASSGRVVEGGVHPSHTAARTATHARTAGKKPAKASAHLRGVKPPHA